MKISFQWKDANRGYWTAAGVVDDKVTDPEVAVWWFTITSEDGNAFGFRIETSPGEEPTRRDVALGLMAHFNGVALSLVTDGSNLDEPT